MKALRFYMIAAIYCLPLCAQSVALAAIGTSDARAARNQSELDQSIRAIAQRVRNALRAAPYFYGTHVTVSVEHEELMLNGFVLSDWDLIEALQIARTAGEPCRVIDNLTIKEGG
jgi:osmotically-inducible protein OsmY